MWITQLKSYDMPSSGTRLALPPGVVNPMSIELVPQIPVTSMMVEAVVVPGPAWPLMMAPQQ